MAYYCKQAVNGNAAKLKLLTAVLDDLFITSVADLQDACAKKREHFADLILDALSQEKPRSRSMWELHVASLFDRGTSKRLAPCLAAYCFPRLRHDLRYQMRLLLTFLRGSGKSLRLVLLCTDSEFTTST